MKRQKKLGWVFLVILMLTCIVGYAAVNPGSKEDPLVSQSYVDQKINELKLYTERIASGGNGGGTSSSAGESTAGNTFVPMLLEKGQTLFAGNGTELIPRDGAQLTAIYGENGGLSDVTAAKDLKMGEAAKANHLLISARNDGRGVKAKVDSWMIVKGDYTIK